MKLNKEQIQKDYPEDPMFQHAVKDQTIVIAQCVIDAIIALGIKEPELHIGCNGEVYFDWDVAEGMAELTVGICNGIHSPLGQVFWSVIKPIRNKGHFDFSGVIDERLVKCFKELGL